MQPKLTVRETAGYSMGALGGGFAFNLVRSYFVVFCMTVLGVSAGFLMVMFVVLRLWDAISDPIVGMLSENLRTPWGKHKPWVIIGAVLNAVVIVFMFSPVMTRMQGIGLLVGITALYMLYGLTYTVIDVPYYAYAASFVDERERDVISTWPRLVGGIAMIGVPVLTRTMVTTLGGQSEAQGYFYWVLLLMGMYILFAGIAAKSMKVREIGRREQAFSFKEAWQTLRQNDQLLIIEVVFILAMTAINVTQMVALFYFAHVWQAPEVFDLFMLVAGAGMALAMLSYPLLAKKISRRKIFIAGCMVPLAGYVLMAGLALTGNPMFMLPIVLFTVGGFGFFGILTSIFMVDAVEYGEWKLGYRSENLIFSLLTLIGKFSGAIATLIFLGAMQLAGYVSTTYGMFADAAIVAQTAQPPAVNVVLNVLMFAVPPVILGLALLLYLKKYKLHGVFLQQITRELEERRDSFFEKKNHTCGEHLASR
ncbi:MAG: glycoside-pentoside-hexuronide (GPH):cation symporter [Oscillospiraceae bacterium]|nr:glycoside-pentoside-hexuronide (GPH):cation symporter [Oscillospiraceae bacterium]